MTDRAFIDVRGARENNLKDISLDIPKRKLTVFTGVSGSGKSSLVFDTIAAETQQIQQDFQALIAYVTGPETRTASAYTVELTLFRRLLALGAALLRVFFLTRAADRPAGPRAGRHPAGLSRLPSLHLLLRLRQSALRAPLLHVHWAGGCVPARRGPEPAGTLLFARAPRVGDVWHDR